MISKQEKQLFLVAKQINEAANLGMSGFEKRQLFKIQLHAFAGCFIELLLQSCSSAQQLFRGPKTNICFLQCL